MNFKEEYYSRTENEISFSRKNKVTGAAKFITPRKPIGNSSVVGPHGHVPLNVPGVNIDALSKPSFSKDTPASAQGQLGYVGFGPGGGVEEEPGADQRDGGAGADQHGGAGAAQFGGAGADNQYPAVQHGVGVQHQATEQLCKEKVVYKKKKTKKNLKLIFIKIWRIL